MAANTISGLGKPRDRFRGPRRALPEAPEGDSDETVSKNSAGPSKTHETVSKNSDRRLKTYDFAWDCQQKQTSGEPPETQKHRILTRLSIKRWKTIENERCRFEPQSQQKARFLTSRHKKKQLFAKTVSKKLASRSIMLAFCWDCHQKVALRTRISSFCWDCQQKVMFQTKNHNVLLRLSAKSFFETANLSFLLRLSAESCIWERES